MCDVLGWSNCGASYARRPQRNTRHAQRIVVVRLRRRPAWGRAVGGREIRGFSPTRQPAGAGEFLPEAVAAHGWVIRLPCSIIVI